MHLQTIKIALEWYRAEKGRYPLRVEGAVGWTSTKAADLTSLLSPFYLPKIPEDPFYPDQFPYLYQISHSEDKYALYARLENVKDPQALTSVEDRYLPEGYNFRLSN